MILALKFLLRLSCLVLSGLCLVAPAAHAQQVTCSLASSPTTVAPGQNSLSTISGANLPAGAMAYWNGSLNGVVDIHDLLAGPLPYNLPLTNDGSSYRIFVRYAVIKDTNNTTVCTTNPVALIFPVSTASSVSYGYDTLARLSSVAYASGTVINYTYDAAGNRKSIQTGQTGAPAAPTFTWGRTPTPMVAGQNYTTTWNASPDATSIFYTCTANGTGFSGMGNLASMTGSSTQTALAAWVGFPSSCLWIVSKPGVAATYTDTMITNGAPQPLPVITASHSPSPMMAGQAYTGYYSVTNAPSLSYNCTASAGGFVGSGTFPNVNGSNTGVADPAWVGHPSTCVYTASGPGGNATFTEILTTQLPTLPVITASHSPSPMVAGQPYTGYYSVTNAPSLSYNCTASASGFVGSGTFPNVNGSNAGVADPAWVGHPSTCVYTASGPGGNATFTEILTTQPPPPVITAYHAPSPMAAGQPYTGYYSVTNAPSLSYNCTASAGGFVGSGTFPNVNGSNTGVADPAWVGHPSTCVYSASGPGGNATFTEILTTN